jgi:hypothetical protein
VVPALICLLVYGLMFNWAFFPPNQTWPQFCFQVVQGLLLAAGIGWMRGGQREALVWLGAGALAGALAYGAQYLYTWEHAVYRAVFYLANHLDPDDSVRMPFRVLQALRVASASLVLALFHAARSGEWARLSFHLPAVLLAAWARFYVWGVPLAPQPLGQRLTHLGLFFVSAWVLYYALGRRRPGEL